AAEEFCRALTGKTRRVLTEELTPDGKFITGYTDNYVKVFLPAGGLDTNTFYDVELTGITDGGMSGKVK
ncbi:MAG: hypothetical protein IIY39_01365, partial [Firmicutes bacterium]|nr:hypothetical protein [Bacillota bacterium]